MPVIHASANDLDACWDAIRSSGRFTEGNYIRLLEGAVSEWYGREAVAVSSAGAGLFAVMRCIGPALQSWRDAAVSNNTFFATGAMAKETGRSVVVLDCNRDDFSLSLEAVEHIPAGVGTVILTHIGGKLADNYFDIAQVCKARGYTLIEDAAHAFGVQDKDFVTAGFYGDAAVFSLYPTKAIPAGEGGIVLTENPDLAEAVRRFRNYGKYVKGGTVCYTGTGFNLRMDEWTAAVAYLQFKKRADIIASRAFAARQLHALIPSMFGEPQHGPEGGNNWYKYPVLREHAEELGITRFAGQVYSKSDQIVSTMGLSPYEGQFPNSQWVADNHVCLPLDEGLYVGMNKDQILAWLRGAT